MMLRLILIISIFSLSISESIGHRNIYKTKHDRNTDNSSINTYNNRNEAELIDYIQSTIETNNIPGLSVSVINQGSIVWNKSFGMANVDDNVEVDENTKFMLASVSKTVTATALMQLWEDGLINLNQNISNYLPFEVIHPDYPNTPITARMLLAHTSGIRDNWGVMDYYPGDPDIALSDYLQQYLVAGGDLYNSNLNYTNNQPGTSFSYSNNGAALVGLLVEAISGVPFNQYCNQNIFEPLSMESRWFLNELDVNNIAMPYNLDNGSGDNCFDIGCGVFNGSNPCQCDQACIDYGDCCFDYEETCGEDGTGSGDATYNPIGHYGYADYPSGQLRTSAKDLAKFLILFSNGGSYQGTNILEEETVNLMKTLPFENINDQQAYMWYYKLQNLRYLFGHNGGDLGVITDMFMSNNTGVGVIVLSNISNYNAVIDIENAIFDYSDNYGFNLIGDLNNDFSVNILDVILVIDIILNSGFNQNADINSDNQINIQDIILLIDIIIS